MKRLNFKDISKVETAGIIHNFKDHIVVLQAEPGIVPENHNGFILEFDIFIFAFITSGTAEVSVNGKEYKFRKHTLCILMPAHTTRLIKASNDLGATFILFKPSNFRLDPNFRENRDFKSWVDLYFNPVMYLSDEESATLEGCIDYLASQIDRTEPEDKDSFVSNAIARYQLEVEFFLKKRMEAGSNPDYSTSRQGHILESLALKIVNNYKTEHKAQFYADQMCFSLQYLNKLMNSQLGMTVGDIISKLLYTTARSMLLSSDMTIQQIAQELNFTNQATFCRFFKNMDGQSPSELRRSSKG